MFDDRWSVVSWPEEFGGRGVGILEWLIFEEEYWRAEAPLRVSQNGVFLLAPTMFEFGTPAQQERFLPAMASGREIWCQGWSEPDAGSRPGRHPQPGQPGPADDDGLAADRTEDLGLAGGVRRVVLRPVPHRPRGRAPPGPHLLPHRHGHPGGDRPAHPPARRGDRLRRAVLRGRLRPRRAGAGRRGPGVERGHGHRRLRAGAQPAQPGPLHRGRRSPGVALRPDAGRPTRTGPRRSADAVARAWMDAEAYRLQHAVDGHPGARTAARSGPRPVPTRSTGPRPTWPSTAPRWPCSAPRPSCTATASTHRGSTATSSPWPGPSTPAPTRSSATWWPSACSGCPRAEPDGTGHRALRLLRPADRVPRRRAPGAGQGVHDRPPPGRLRTARRPGVPGGPPWPSWAWSASPSPRPVAASDSAWSTWSCCSRRPVGWRCPSRCSRRRPWPYRSWPSWTGAGVGRTPPGTARGRGRRAMLRPRWRDGHPRRAAPSPPGPIAGAARGRPARAGPWPDGGTGGRRAPRRGRGAAVTVEPVALPRSHPPAGHPPLVAHRRDPGPGRRRRPRPPSAGPGRPGRRRHRRRAARPRRADDHPRRRVRQGAPASSAGPSAASRPSSTCWPGPRSAWSSPGRSSTAPPGPSTTAPRTPRAPPRWPRPTPPTPPLEAARVSLQVHGAIGYTWECDLHLFLKRAWALAEAWGSAADHRALVLEHLVAGLSPGRNRAATRSRPTTRSASARAKA